MKFKPFLLFAALAAAASSSVQASSTAPRMAHGAGQKQAWGPDDFAVYVDQETGFAFIKTPVGWRFIRRIEPEKLAMVPREFFVRVDQRHGVLLAQNPRH